jgi:hypothetical protein
MIAHREHPEQVTTGDRRRGAQHWIYGRAHELCRRCRAYVADRRDRPQAGLDG